MRDHLQDAMNVQELRSPAQRSAGGGAAAGTAA